MYMHLFVFAFFFFMLPPPPTSTLFPYTTLFRSVHESGLGHRLRPRAGAGDGHAEETLRAARGDEFLDRKSTRLNSSHGYISYAVFCLKKKNYMQMSQ